MKILKKILSISVSFVLAFSTFVTVANAELSLFPEYGDLYPSYSDSTDITVLAPSTDRAPYSSNEVRLSNNAVIVTDVVWGEAAPYDSSFRWMSYGESFKEGYEYRVAIRFGINPSALTTTYDHTITINGQTPTKVVYDNAVYGTAYYDFDNLVGSGSSGGFFDIILSIIAFPFRIILAPFLFIFGLI